MKEGWDSENKAMQQFDIDGIPFVTLLDKEGKIVFKGHPSECKIEDEINRLIAAPPS
jgi:predicted DsbA family dithiol-disulfide isomerase